MQVEHVDTNAVLEEVGIDPKNFGFFVVALKSLNELFEKAKNTNEVQYAFSLNAEFRGSQTPGWNTADEANRAFEDYLNFLQETEWSNFKGRVALAFYCHLAESSGYYEVPKNMLRVASGEYYNLYPFQHLVRDHRETGKKIAPNANKVLQDLAGHAEQLGLHDLAVVFTEAFNGDIRNGYAHADYVVWSDGIRLPKRNGGIGQIITWDEFKTLLYRAINLFNMLRHITEERKRAYFPARKVMGRFYNDKHDREFTIAADPEIGTFTISG